MCLEATRGESEEKYFWRYLILHYFKKISAAVAALCIAFSAVPTTALAEAASYGIVTASVLNIRQGATTASAIIGQASNGTYVTINWLEPGWARITCDGVEGYVSLDYLKVVEGAMPSRSGAVSSRGQAVVELAKQYLGTPYRYGGAAPGGFDCSGFVYYIYSQLGVTLNRVAADQMTNGTWVDKGMLQPGDIVGFKNSSGYINHVGIYAGNGMMIHSPQTGDVVKYESIVTGNYSKRLTCGRRIF